MEPAVEITLVVLSPFARLLQVNEIHGLEMSSNIFNGPKWTATQLFSTQLGLGQSICVVDLTFTMTRAREVKSTIGTIWANAIWGEVFNT